MDQTMLVELDAYAETERRLREWGSQCGPLEDPEARRPYRDTTIKEMHDIGKTWRQNVDLRKERDQRRREASKKAAATRKARAENSVKLCQDCGHLHFSEECKRCAGDPKYTALGKETRSFNPITGIVRRVTGAAAEIDAIVARLIDWQRDVLFRRYWRGQPLRISAKEMLISRDKFDEMIEAAIEQVAEMLAERNSAAV